MAMPERNGSDKLLFCGTCGYDLTGLPSNRCPECGLEFNEASLRKKLEWGSGPIDVRRMIVLLLMVPALRWTLLGLGFLFGWSRDDDRIFLFIISIVAIPFAVFISMTLADVFAARRSIRLRQLPEGRRHRVRFLLLTCAFLLVQLALALGPSALLERLIPRDW